MNGKIAAKTSVMNKEYKGFEGLIVYQEARAYRKRISKLAAGFPPAERYSLADQIKRSSRSVTANIAEGYGRYHYKEFIQFCRQARGSLMETLDHLLCAFDESYITEETLNDCRLEHQKVLALLNGFINYLQQQMKAEKSTGKDASPKTS
jgi:four helix bundle protein